MRSNLFRNPVQRGLILCFLACLAAPIRGQSLPTAAFEDSLALPIVDITLVGNHRTRPQIILREMKSRIGDPFDPDVLEQDRKRIQSLNLFNRVQTHVSVENDSACIYLLLTEKWYWFPYPILFLNNRDWNQLSWGAGLVHMNFRGRAENLSVLFWLGYNPAAQISYANPWLGGKRHLTFDAGAWTQRVRSLHYRESVTEQHAGSYAALGKRWGLHRFARIQLGYREVAFTPPENESGTGEIRNRLPNIGISFALDTRDLKEYPHSGHRLAGWIRAYGWSGHPRYLLYGFDIRHYIPWGKNMTVAWRAAADFSAGTLPVYDRFYLGYDERIRGHFHEVREGEFRALAGLAVRVPLIPVRYFSLTSVPQLTDLKYGLSLGFFADTGVTWLRKGKPKDWMSGFGMGLHLHLPYINVLRLEWALNESGRSEFIADLFVDI